LDASTERGGEVTLSQNLAHVDKTQWSEFSFQFFYQYPHYNATKSILHGNSLSMTLGLIMKATLYPGQAKKKVEDHLEKLV
jgi:hypothetical protein